MRRTWRIGLLTNGSPEIQRAKVAALGLAALMDVIVYAHEVSDGKPDSPAFEAVCDRLRVAPDRAVMAGDDPWCDIDGARGACRRAARAGDPHGANDRNERVTCRLGLPATRSGTASACSRSPSSG